MEKISIKNMSRSELDTVIAWAAAEGWNPGINDAECFYAADPNGFFMAFDKDENPLGAVSAVAYDESFGFIGLYIVRPEYRGHMVGPLLWRKAMEYLGTRNSGLDGVEKKVKNYEARGFKLAYRNIRYEGVKNFPAGLKPGVAEFNGKSDMLVLFDRKFFPAKRDKFLDKWMNAPDSKTFYFHENSSIKAYGVIRKCLEGFKIGPLFAEEYDYAEAVMLALLSGIPDNSKFYLDIPELNENSVRLVSGYNMKSVFGTVRMYNKNFPELPVGKIYGITSFELG
jgi:GNAT superfamily N-acetyltransferase